jgi:F0F1-type ATP synthase membrane subunit c/vacuolar-type H+-ATPase subunit K
MRKMKKKIVSIIMLVSFMIGISIGGQTYAAQTKSGNTKDTVNTTINESANGRKQTNENSDQISQTGEEQNNNTIKGDLENNQAERTKEVTEEKSGLSNHDIGLLAAALATGLACIGAGIAVAMVASSAIGAISENPGLLGKTIIFAGLAEGIAIYGLIISIMILNKV